MAKTCLQGDAEDISGEELALCALATLNSRLFFLSLPSCVSLEGILPRSCTVINSGQGPALMPENKNIPTKREEETLPEVNNVCRHIQRGSRRPFRSKTLLTSRGHLLSILKVVPNTNMTVL